MKLIDILVQELPKRGGWPDGVARLAQDPDGDLQKLSNNEAHFISGLGWAGRGRDDFWGDYHFREMSAIADDNHTAIITREQYEAALAAKNDGWIYWGGGECPVDTKTLVDIKLKDGFTYKSCHAGDYSWRHGWHNVDIIAYRLHQPQEVTEDNDESDLNECIGQDVAPVWDGGGVIPPVGCVCERSWAGDEWQSCKILFASGQIVVVKLKESGREDAYNIGDVTFRPTSPIRSEAEQKREEAVKAITLTGWCQTAAEEIYDLIAAGKVPGMKLED